MIELFLSTDGKHTVHVTAETPEEMADLAPHAKALYQKTVAEFGNKAQMWSEAMHGNGNGHSNGNATAGKRIDTVAQALAAVAPVCPVHQKAMVLRNGRRGPFWSCPTRNPDDSWCRVTKEVATTVYPQSPVA